MDMTRDFLNAILELDAPHIVEYGDIRLVDKDMKKLPKNNVAEPLKTGTLTSLWITSIMKQIPLCYKMEDMSFTLESSMK